ncbi:MAG: threonine/serine exporter family protein [Streptosporangiaceae bacterium]
MGEAPDDSAAEYGALELALRVGELMLAGGEAAERVERAILHLTQVYGLPRCEANVTLAAISVSYLPGHGRPPVTGERMVRKRRADFTRLVEVHRLVVRAEHGDLTLMQAKDRLHAITAGRAPYPDWVLHGALALIGGAGAVLVGGRLWAALAAFTATLLGDRAGDWLGRRGVAEFFQVAVAAAIGSLMSVALVASGTGLYAGAVIIGVVIALIPGRALVASLQDGIAGDYMTGSVRLVEALFIISAILSGVGFTIYVATRLGVQVSLEHLPYAKVTTQPAPLLASGVIAAAFAVYVVAPLRWVLTAVLGGMASWTIFVLLLDHQVAAAAATLVATIALGIFGTAYARIHGIPPVVAVLPCVAPLMPGTLMYRGLLETTTGHADQGALILVEAISTALALGAGVIIGAEILRAFVPVSDRAKRVMFPVTRRVRR